MSEDYRYEIKFILDNFELSDVMQWLYTETTAVNAYDNRVVNSIYFDDLDFSAVRDNLAGISQRNKFRLRWYGSKIHSEPKFEVKTRNGRLGRKSTYQLNFVDNSLRKFDYADITTKCIKNLAEQNVFFDDHLIPTLHIDYKREYFETHNGIRITIDHDIRFMDAQANNTYVENIISPYPLKVMEIKFAPSMQVLVSNLIRSLHITPKRHSKYLIGLATLGYAVYI